ncbi:MAG TPA: diguanylate cyclase [Terriglobales bacterium]|nr:diguanylate cyclase [Terriglobales bacterium]
MDINLIRTLAEAAVAALLLAFFSLYLRWRTTRLHGQIHENLLAFSSLDVDPRRMMDATDLVPSLKKFLDRLAALLKVESIAISMEGPLRSTLPSVQRGFTKEFLERGERYGGLAALAQLARARGGIYSTLDLQTEARGDPERAAAAWSAFQPDKVWSVTAVRLQTHEREFGLLVFGHPRGQTFTQEQTRLLKGVAMQIALTLENYVFMHDAQRRTREFELMTQIGQVVSSRLDPDEVLLAVQRELGRLFDTSTFYVAFQFGDQIRFELEVEEGEIRPKRSTKASNGLTEYIVRTGRPLLVEADMEAARTRLGLESSLRPAKSYCGVPILMYGRPVGAMATMHYAKEYVYGQRDLDVMTTASGYVAVAIENARMFAEEQRRSRYLGFLNNISKTAISSQDADQMMAEIVGEIQKNFHYDHIGIGLLDYATKDIEIKAEAGSTAQALGKRVPLGVGILGRAARTSEMVLVQNTGESHLLGILPESKSVLCVPIAYSETMLGVLNVESRRENAFSEQEVLILRTLADLLATALHNAFVFQKMQQQSITDGLTGIKTRRFFLEALQAEWKRASRTGRPFSVVLIDLDKFKEVNDSMGHLEGDLVLARIGRLLEQKVRQSNVVARYGGDEFIILMPETGMEQAQILSERLRLWIATDPMLNERHITGSFGVATFPLHGATVEDVVRVADAGMYVSKRKGGNHVSIAGEFAEGGLQPHQQLISSYVEGFLQREHTGPSAAEELVSTLRQLSAEASEGDRAEVLMNALRTLTRAAESREIAASGHGESVARIAEAIGRELMLKPEDLADLVYAARVHDVGKIVIPERFLNKPDLLNESEYSVVKEHVRLGSQLLELVPGAMRVVRFVRHHHERFDGSGYPDGLKGEEIPLGARIIGVAEAYALMTTERPYAQVRSQQEAIAEMESLSGTQFDGMLVRLLVHHLKTKADAPARKGR